MDMRPIVLGIPTNLICLRQYLPDDLAQLARLIFFGEVDFTPLVHEVERDGGTEFVRLVEYGFSRSRNTSWNAGWSEGESASDSENWSHSVADALNWTKSRARQESHSSQHVDSHQDSSGLSRRRDPGLPAQDRLRQEETLSEGSAAGSSDARGHSAGWSESDGAGGGRTVTGGNGGARQTGTSTGVSGGHGGGEAEGESYSVRHAQIRRVVREMQQTGQLRRSVADQLEEHAQRIFRLKRQEAFVRLGTDVHRIRTVDVPDAFLGPDATVLAVDWLLRELSRVHDYLFVPDLSAGEEDRRVRHFLGIDGNSNRPLPAPAGGNDPGNPLA